MVKIITQKNVKRHHRRTKSWTASVRVEQGEKSILNDQGRNSGKGQVSLWQVLTNCNVSHSMTSKQCARQAYQSVKKGRPAERRKVKKNKVSAPK